MSLEVIKRIRGTSFVVTFIRGGFSNQHVV